MAAVASPYYYYTVPLTWDEHGCPSNSTYFPGNTLQLPRGYTYSSPAPDGSGACCIYCPINMGGYVDSINGKLLLGCMEKTLV